MTRNSQIFQWRAQVKADRGLSAIDFMVAYQLSERTSADEFAKSGRLLTWQGLALLASDIGVCERTVQRSVRRLQKFKHLAIKAGGGRHHSNRYTLILQAVAALDDNSKTLTAVSSFIENPDSGVTLSAETLTAETTNPDSRVAKPRQPCHPNSYRTTDRTLATTTETEQAGLAAPLKALGPLGHKEPELRRRLGDDFKVLCIGKVIEQNPDGAILIEVLTPANRDDIRRYCEAGLLEATGARELKFTIAIAADPPKLRRMP